MSELKDVSEQNLRKVCISTPRGLSPTLYAVDIHYDEYESVIYGNAPEEALANARLMAAAKDMAEALQKGVEVFAGLVGQTHDERAAVEKFRVALKKAGAA